MSTLEYIKNDLYRYKGRVSLSLFLMEFFYNRGFVYSFWLRCSQSKYKIISYPSMVILKLKSWKYGIQISPKVKVGYGLYIGHGMSIVVNPTAVIGNNVNLSQFTTIGSNSGPAAIIGNNVYIGPNVCLIGNISVGNDVTIGASAVVTKNVPDNVTVAGVPAKIINQNNHKDYVHNKWPTL